MIGTIIIHSTDWNNKWASDVPFSSLPKRLIQMLGAPGITTSVEYRLRNAQEKYRRNSSPASGELQSVSVNRNTSKFRRFSRMVLASTELSDRTTQKTLLDETCTNSVQSVAVFRAIATPETSIQNLITGYMSSDYRSGV